MTDSALSTQQSYSYYHPMDTKDLLEIFQGIGDSVSAVTDEMSRLKQRIDAGIDLIQKERRRQGLDRSHHGSSREEQSDLPSGRGKKQDKKGWGDRRDRERSRRGSKCGSQSRSLSRDPSVQSQDQRNSVYYDKSQKRNPQPSNPHQALKEKKQKAPSSNLLEKKLLSQHPIFPSELHASRQESQLDPLRKAHFGDASSIHEAFEEILPREPKGNAGHHQNANKPSLIHGALANPIRMIKGEKEKLSKKRYTALIRSVELNLRLIKTSQVTISLRHLEDILQDISEAMLDSETEQRSILQQLLEELQGVIEGLRNPPKPLSRQKRLL